MSSRFHVERSYVASHTWVGMPCVLECRTGKIFPRHAVTVQWSSAMPIAQHNASSKDERIRPPYPICGGWRAEGGASEMWSYDLGAHRRENEC